MAPPGPAPDPLLAAVLCNDAREQDGKLTGDPLDVALWRWAEQEGLVAAATRSACPRLEGVAFDARSRYMSVTCAVDGARRVFAKGAPEAILALAGITVLPPALALAEDAATLGRRKQLCDVAEAELAAEAPGGRRRTPRA